MLPQSLDGISDDDLYTLAVWRESSNQGEAGRTGVAWSIRNRYAHPGWWGHDLRSVILKPYQYSSFNPNDTNSKRWPQEGDESWPEIQAICAGVRDGTIPDPTDGATNYYSTDIEFPKGWGAQSGWINTFNTGAFKFWKMRPADSEDA